MSNYRLKFDFVHLLPTVVSAHIPEYSGNPQVKAIPQTFHLNNINCTFFKVVKNGFYRCFHALSRTAARFCRQDLAEPIDSCVIDRLCDVKTTIKAFMVSSTKNKHNFSSIMRSSRNPQLWALLKKNFRMNKESFMSEKFTTLLILLSIMFLCAFLKQMTILGCH